MRCLLLFSCILIVFVSCEGAYAWPARAPGPAIELLPKIEMARWRHRYRYDEETEKSRRPPSNRDETIGFGSLLQPFISVVRPEGRRRTRWIDPPPPR